MARLVKEKLTGKRYPKEELYRVEETLPSGKKRTEYYLSEEAFLENSKNTRYRKLCMEKVGELFGYFDGGKFPKEILRDIEDLASMYSYEDLYEAIRDAYDDIQYALSTKSFDSEFGKCRYVMVILQRKIDNVSKRVMKMNQKSQTVNEEDLVVTETKRAEPTKRSIAFLLEDDE